MHLNEREKTALELGSVGIEKFSDRMNDLPAWKEFFKNKILLLADLSDKTFDSLLEPIAYSKKISISQRWHKKFTSYKNGFNLPSEYSFDTFYKEYLELEDALKKYSLESLGLSHNTLWTHTRGYEYLQIIKSGYKNGVLNHACSNVVKYDSQFHINVHPGRHSHWARRFLKQNDIHCLSIKNEDYDEFMSSYPCKIIKRLYTINDIVESAPKQAKEVRIFLQGTNKNSWPFIVPILDLPNSDWGELDENNQITIAKNLKNKVYGYSKLVDKLNNGYDPRIDYQVNFSRDLDYIQRLYFAFCLNEKHEDNNFVLIK